MTLHRWLILLGIVVGLGCLQVATRNAMMLKGYAVGARMQQVHTAETDVSWMDAEIIRLCAPRHLAQVAQQRKLKLVAWSALQAGPSYRRTASRVREDAGPLTFASSDD